MSGEEKHKDRAHARLSPSGAARWINCTPSPFVEDEMNMADTTSVYAEEGTLAHEFCDLELKKAMKYINAASYKRQLKSIKANELYSDDMIPHVQKYVDIVLEIYNVAQAKYGDAVMAIEEKVDLTQYIPEGFGACDVNIASDNVLSVIDFKYGQGVSVGAERNPQMMLYALGALKSYDIMYDIDTIEMHIIQPRISNYSSYVMSKEDLLKWANDVVKPKAKEAFKGEGVKRAGSWCKWCKAKPLCDTVAAYHLKLAQMEYKAPNLLTDDQMAEVFERASTLADWVGSVQKYMLSEAIKGKKYKGLKVVRGKSNRKFSDTEEVQNILIDNLYAQKDYLNSKLKGIGDLEKLVGKKEFGVMFKDLVFKPPGAPVLVPSTDKREEMNSAQSDFK